MAGRYGPESVFILVDGYDFIPFDWQELESTVESETAETTGLGDDFREHTPTGVAMGALSLTGAVFDTATSQSHAALSGSIASDPQDDGRVAVFGLSGETIGEPMFGFEGALQTTYRVTSSVDDLQRVNADWQVTGERDEGVILQPLEAKTADGDTESSSVDNSASSPDGGAGYMQCTALTLDGYTNIVAKVRDSSDDSTFADLVTFTAVTAAPAAERVEVTGTVNRYLAASWAYTGSGTSPSASIFVGFARN